MKRVNKILACIDFSDYTANVVTYSRLLAQAADNKVLLFNVINSRDVDAFKTVSPFLPGEFRMEDYIEKHRTDRHRRLAELIEQSCPEDKDRFSTCVNIGVPFEEILNCLKSNNIDIVIMGNKGRGNFVGTLFGSNAEKVFRHSPVPVLSVRDRKYFRRKLESVHPEDSVKESGIRCIVAAVDFSEYSPEVLRYSSEIAEQCGADVVVVNVIDTRRVDSLRKVIDSEHPGTFSAEKFLRNETAKRRARMDDFIKKWGSHNVVMRKSIKNGVPSKEILATIDEEKGDMLIVNSKGRTNLSEYLFGTTAEKTFRHCPVSVLSLNRKR